MNEDYFLNNYVDNILGKVKTSDLKELTDSPTYESEEVTCPICFDTLREEDEVVLKCGHKFHYSCILDTFKNDNKKYTKNKNKCPYCRGNGGFLPFREGMIPLKYIHKEYDEYIKNGNIEKYLVKGVCKAILKSGKNAGCQCKSKIFKDGFCKRHYNQYN